MTELKSSNRLTVKWVRDRAKARYKKDIKCYICGETESLDFHHHFTLTPLLRRWMLKNGMKDTDVLVWRDKFIAEHEYELYEATITLCHTNHLNLHKVYGKTPGLGTAKKQIRWAGIQKEKFKGKL